jgi:DNA-binding NarL/FixJ family response regulator
MNDVLIVEDHPFVAEATRELIARAHPALSTTVCNAAEPAMRALRQPARSWHRILPDLDIPGAHGLSFALAVQKLELASITCIVTAADRPDFIAQVKAHGFLGYIVKAMPAQDFSAALSKIFLGERVFPKAAPLPTSAVVRITRRQTEILGLVSSGYSSKQIALRLCLTEGTVNNHMNALMGVLNAATRSHAVAKAIELGLLCVPSGALASHRGRSADSVQ